MAIPTSSNITKPNMFSRIVAFAIDFSLVVFLSYFSSRLIYTGFQNSNTELSVAVQGESKHIVSSHLAQKDSSGSYISYAETEYFDITETGFKIIDSLSYFYLVYLAGDTSKAINGDVVSPNADVEMDVGGVKTTPRNLYTVSWFNENVLSLPKEGESPKYDYFEYYKTAGDEIDYSRVGKVNAKYIKAEVVDETEKIYVDAPAEMTSYAYHQYKKAIDNLFDQNYMVEFNKTKTSTNQLITLLSREFFVLVFFVLIPLLTKHGKTLGKLLFRLKLVNFEGEDIKKWQVLPRSLTFIAIPLLLYLVTNFYIQLGIISGIIVVSIVLFVIDKQNKRALHDYIARTVVSDDTITSEN